MELKRKEMTGRVASDKMQKTVVVAVDKFERHPIYHRSIRRVAKYKVDDAEGIAKVGDVVRIVETRPLSKEKRWRVAEVLEHEGKVKVE